MKIIDIPKNLHVKRPVQNSKSRGGLKVFGAGAGRKFMKLFRPIRPGENVDTVVIQNVKEEKIWYVSKHCNTHLDEYHK